MDRRGRRSSAPAPVAAGWGRRSWRSPDAAGRASDRGAAATGAGVPRRTPSTTGRMIIRLRLLEHIQGS
ncbi:hypothetical protein ACFQ60_25380 [Streptomyces zhihengii]